MAIFKCPSCLKLVERDMRTNPMRRHRGKTKYKSYCGINDTVIFMMKQGGK